jgi:serine/threonine protein kinase/tetratricopeptide (TPR) repeat protein
MGQVYRARDPRLQRDIALKVLQTDNPQQRRRFEREALSVAALNHPNIVTIHSVEEADGIPFITMELVDGTPLGEVIPPGGLPLRDLLPLAIQIADALAAAHDRGIVHRDLKPANVMVGRDGRVKLMDFGLAKLTQPAPQSPYASNQETREGIVVGTLAYMSPEQLMAHAVDARSDIFSFGILLYEMATGQRPFEGPNRAMVLVSLLNNPLPAVGVSHGDLDRIIARATARKPGARYQRTADLVGDLRALSSGMVLRAPPVSRQPSIAVLPFSNLTGDPSQDYFCDGMAEELIGALARIRGLSVAARTSAFQFKGQPTDVREIGERLGVLTVLEGSVRTAGNRLRITAQLINVADGYHLWSDRYDRTVDDVFEIQDEIAKAITDSLRVTLTQSGSGTIVRGATSSIEAYNAYLRGRFMLNNFVGLADSLVAARGCFEQAVLLDPDFAPAHAALSECFNALGFTSLLPGAIASHGALKAAQRALSLNPDLPEAHTALGWTKTLFAIDLPSAEQHFEQALRLSPTSAPAHAYYAFWLAAYGRFAAAHEHADRAQELDPLWQHNPFTKCEILLCERRFQDLERLTREFIALDARFEGMFWYLSNALAGQGRLPEAIDVMERSVGVVRRLPYFLALLGQWYGRGGRRDEAKAVLGELRDSPRCSASWLALVCCGLRDLDNAFTHLDQAIDEHNDQCQLTFMAVDHRFDELRVDPRFDLALNRLGLPKVARTENEALRL